MADEQLLTLDELTTRLPAAANAATHLDWHSEQVVVLDIEPDCPPQVTRQLLRLVTGNSAQDPPPVLYSEVSMSGKGYHLVLPVPEAMFTIPGVSRRNKLQHPNKWFEVLMYHWITFSRQPIPAEVLEQAAADPAGEDLTWEGLFTQLAQIAPGGRQVGQAMSDLAAGQALQVELDQHERQVVQAVLDRHRRTYTKTLRDDFGGDTSRWEFSILCALAGHTDTLLRIHAMADSLAQAQSQPDRQSPPTMPPPAEPDRTRALRIMYTAALEAIPHRNKHDGTRSGLPYLLKQATVALATTSVSSDHLAETDPDAVIDNDPGDGEEIPVRIATDPSTPTP